MSRFLLMAALRKASRKGNFSKILTVCIVFGGGILVLALLYNALFSSTDTRSKAAVSEVVLKTWNFDTTAEGWSVKGVPSTVRDGRMTFPLGPANPPVTLSYSETVPVPDTTAGKKLKVRIAAALSGNAVLGTTSNSEGNNDQESVIPGAPGWFRLVPANLRNFLELLYQWIFVYKRPSNLGHLLEGLVNAPPDTNCIQVIQPARNKETGECRQFPTPCDVPEGWVADNTCNEGDTGRPTPTPTRSSGCTPPPECLFLERPCRQAAPLGGWCPPPTSRVLMQLVNTGGNERLSSAAIPIDGVMREYDLPLSTLKALSLQFSPQLAVSAGADYSISSVQLYVDWMKVAASQVTVQCIVSGCISEQCVDAETARQQAHELCVPVPNVCYGKAKCETQSTGKCGWTHTEESKACLKNSPTPTPPPGCHYQQVQCIQAPCDPILVCTTPTPTHSGTCKTTGCSGQLCSDKDITTTCEYKPEYACYGSATCTRLNSGQCGWVQTPELQSCIEKARNPDTSKPCKVTGCSSQLCSDQELMSTSEYRAEYACYHNATCTRQNNGHCGWTQTTALTSCIENARNGNSSVSF